MESVIAIGIPASFVLALIVERLFPARPLPRVKGWLLKGILFFAFTGVVNSALPAIVAMVVGRHAPLDLRALGTLGGGLVAFLVADLMGYGIHRTMHNVPFLWRWMHQMHHSAERMDLAGMSYSHPFDTLTAFTLPAFATGLLGVSPAAGGLAGLIGYTYALIQHSNVRTPRWLGVLLMRPEMHGLHHARGVHAFNYGNLPLWDYLFGTYRNPEGFPTEYGFWDGASAKMGTMLVGRDVVERG